jgi:hypothetical protein
MMSNEERKVLLPIDSSIDQIGVEGTMKLKMTELYGELSKSGAIPTVIVTEAPFLQRHSTLRVQPERARAVQARPSWAEKRKPPREWALEKP